MKVGIYARTSKAEGGDETSIPVQIADCREHAEEEGWDVVGEFVDPGITGWRRKVRPEYERLFAGAEAGRIDAVLARDYERLLRNDKEGQRWLELYETRGFAQFLFADEADIDLRRARDRKDWKERVAAAVYYSDRLSEKVRRTKRRQGVEGVYTGGEREPFGYRRAADGTLEVDPEEAAILRDAIARLARGEAATRVCREWNVAGIRTSRGARWSPRTLVRILTSEHVTGGRGYPRVLEDDEAALVRGILASRARPAGRPAGVSAPASGFLRCGECGTGLSSNGSFYRCTTSHGGCGGVSIRSLPLERWLLLECLRRWLKAGDRSPSVEEQQSTADAAPVLAELRRLDEQEDEIGAALADDALTVRAAGEATRRIRERRDELTEALARTLPAPSVEPLVHSLVEVFTPAELEAAGLKRFVTARTLHSADEFRRRWEERDPLAVSQVRTLFTEVLDRATISRRERRGRGFAPERVEIAWKT